MHFASVFITGLSADTVSTNAGFDPVDIREKAEKTPKIGKCKIKAYPHKIGYVIVCTSFFYEAQAPIMRGLRGYGCEAKNAWLFTKRALLRQRLQATTPRFLQGVWAGYYHV
jgi:hypothetical protein